MVAIEPPNLNPLQFSIRSLLLLIAGAAVLLALGRATGMLAVIIPSFGVGVPVLILTSHLIRVADAPCRYAFPLKLGLLFVCFIFFWTSILLLFLASATLLLAIMRIFE